MKKTIYCLVAPKFWPLREIPSQEHCINVSHYLLTKHCLSSGGFFDNKYESIQSIDEVDRESIFRLSYTKRLPTLIMDSSLTRSSNNPLDDSINVIRSFFDSLYGLTEIETLALQAYIKSDSFKQDADEWLDNCDLKRTGYSYNYQKKNSVNSQYRLSNAGSDYLNATSFSDEAVKQFEHKGGIQEFREIFHKLSTLYQKLIESERPHVSDTNFWSIDGVSSAYDVIDHQNIAMITDRSKMIERIGQIYQARKTWVIPYEVECN